MTGRLTPAEAVEVARRALVGTDDEGTPIASDGYVWADADGYSVPLDIIDDTRLLVHLDGSWEWQHVDDGWERALAMEPVDLDGRPMRPDPRD